MFSSIEKLVNERASSPLFSTFIVSWILWNWRIFYLTFFIDSELIFPKNKIEFIAQNYSSYWFTLVFPLVSTALLIYAIPFIENKTYGQYLKYREQRRKMKEASDSRRMVPVEELSKQRKNYLEEIRQVEEELSLRKQDIDELNKRISQVLAERKGLEIAYAAYGKPDDMREVTQDVRKGVKDNELKFTITNNAFTIGDPAPGILKQFFMVYQQHGKFRKVTLKEGDNLKILDVPEGAIGLIEV